MIREWLVDEFVPNLFSVIVPTYNRAHTIVETLDSVKAQTHRPIEVIVVDDGSTDNTKEIVQAWSQENEEGESFLVKYFFQENAGVGAARNYALSICRGEFIQFLDSDDLIHEDRFEKVFRVFRDTSCDYIETGFEGFYEKRGDSDEVHYGHDKTGQIPNLLKGKLWPNTLRPVYRRSLVKRTGPWSETMNTLQDYEYAIRALVQNPKTKAEAIGEVLASARRHQGPRMSDIIKTRHGRELRVYCEALLCERVKECDYISLDLKQILASRIYGLGSRCYLSGWPDLGKRCGVIAATLEVELDTKGKLCKLAWRGRRVGGLVYGLLGKVKRVFCLLG